MACHGNRYGYTEAPDFALLHVGKKLKLCIAVHGATHGWPAAGKPAEYGYSVDVTTQDMTQPVPPTVEQIFSEKQAAARQGDVDAQFWLCKGMAELFDDGYSYPVQAATIWCRKEGYKWAPGGMGSMYERGLGVPKDDTQTTIWYRKGVEKGDINAQF